jgi:cytidine deaminase
MIDKRTQARLVAAARHARKRAYSTHRPKRIKVGAALLAADGTIFEGCNISNDSSTLGVCAERVAVFSAVAQGKRRFKAIAVVGGGVAPWTPCGMCRQVLSQFDPKGTMEVIMAGRAGKPLRATLRELYPLPFRVEG